MYLLFELLLIATKKKLKDAHRIEILNWYCSIFPAFERKFENLAHFCQHLLINVDKSGLNFQTFVRKREKYCSTPPLKYHNTFKSVTHIWFCAILFGQKVTVCSSLTPFPFCYEIEQGWLLIFQSLYRSSLHRAEEVPRHEMHERLFQAYRSYPKWLGLNRACLWRKKLRDSGTKYSAKKHFMLFWKSEMVG